MTTSLLADGHDPANPARPGMTSWTTATGPGHDPADAPWPGPGRVESAGLQLDAGEHPDAATAASAPETPARPPEATRQETREIPRWLLPRPRCVAALLLLQVLILPAVGYLAVVGWPVWQLVLAWSVPVAVLALVRVRGMSTIDRARSWRAWRGRVRRARRLTRSERGGNPLSVITDGIVAGSVPGPWSSELGILTDTAGWSCALQVHEPSQETERDWLELALALPPGDSRGVETRLVLQYTAAGRQGQEPTMGAWLVVRVDPVPGAAPGVAARALPGVLRSQVRDLVNAGHDSGLEVSPLGKRELVAGLAGTTEIPLSAPAAHGRGVREAWLEWFSHGRSHRSLGVVRPARRAWAPRAAVDAAVSCAADIPSAVLTASLRLDPAATPSRRLPLMLRLSHEAEATTATGIEALRTALARCGLRTRRLTGAQGPAVVATSLLGERAPR